MPVCNGKLCLGAIQPDEAFTKLKNGKLKAECKKCAYERTKELRAMKKAAVNAVVQDMVQEQKQKAEEAGVSEGFQQFADSIKKIMSTMDTKLGFHASICEFQTRFTMFMLKGALPPAQEHLAGVESDLVLDPLLKRSVFDCLEHQTLYAVCHAKRAYKCGLRDEVKKFVIEHPEFNVVVDSEKDYERLIDAGYESYGVKPYTGKPPEPFGKIPQEGPLILGTQQEKPKLYVASSKQRKEFFTGTEQETKDFKSKPFWEGSDWQCKIINLAKSSEESVIEGEMHIFGGYQGWRGGFFSIPHKGAKVDSPTSPTFSP